MCPSWSDTLAAREAGTVPGFVNRNLPLEDQDPSGPVEQLAETEPEGAPPEPVDPATAEQTARRRAWGVN